MSYRADRAEFLAIIQREGMSRAAALCILRNAEVLQQIAVDDCSGEAAYLWMESQRARCATCQHEAPSDRVYRITDGRPRLCPEHLAEQAIRLACAGSGGGGAVPRFDGDPRGAVVKLRVPSGYSNSFGGEYVCVPTKGGR